MRPAAPISGGWWKRGGWVAAAGCGRSATGAISWARGWRGWGGCLRTRAFDSRCPLLFVPCIPPGTAARPFSLVRPLSRRPFCAAAVQTRRWMRWRPSCASFTPSACGGCSRRSMRHYPPSRPPPPTHERTTDCGGGGTDGGGGGWRGGVPLSSCPRRPGTGRGGRAAAARKVAPGPGARRPSSPPLVLTPLRGREAGGAAAKRLKSYTKMTPRPTLAPPSPLLAAVADTPRPPST